MKSKSFLLLGILLGLVLLFSFTINDASAFQTLIASGGTQGSGVCGGTSGTPQSNSGGCAGGSSTGGGGGAGVAGLFQHGGNGLQVNITGTNTYYGGGGGGSTNTFGCSFTPSAIDGGLGGGGHGGAGNPTTGHDTCEVSVAGNDGLGGGGGSGFFDVGKVGGSGVVIVSYLNGTLSATGGTISFASGHTIHTFLSNSTFTVISGSGNLLVLVVGGGGGSTGFGALGGGGGGGLNYTTTYPVTPSSFNVVVGSGGSNTGGTSYFAPIPITAPSVATSGEIGGHVVITGNSIITKPAYSIVNNPSVPNNACIIEQQLYNFSTFIETMPVNHCFTLNTDYFESQEIGIPFNNSPSMSTYFVYTVFNIPVIDLNNTPTATNTTTVYHFSVSQFNSTTSIGGSPSFQPVQPPPEVPVQPSAPSPVQQTGAAPSNDVLSNVIDTIQKLLGLKKAGFELNVANKFYQLQADSLVNDKINVRWNSADDLAITSITVGDSPIMIQVPKTPFKLTGGYSQSSSDVIPIKLTIPNQCAKENLIFSSCVEVKDYKIPLTITGTTASGITAIKTSIVEVDLTNIDLVYAGIFVFAGIGGVGIFRRITRRKRSTNENSFTRFTQTSENKKGYKKKGFSKFLRELE